MQTLLTSNLNSINHYWFPSGENLCQRVQREPLTHFPFVCGHFMMLSKQVHISFTVGIAACSNMNRPSTKVFDLMVILESSCASPPVQNIRAKGCGRVYKCGHYHHSAFEEWHQCASIQLLPMDLNY